MKFTCTGKVSTNQYVTVLKIVKPWKGDLSIDMRENGSAALLYQIKAANIDDESTANILCTDMPLAKNGSAYEVEASGLSFVYVSVKSAAVDVSGNFTCTAEL
jgi:hypothetical protein